MTMIKATTSDPEVLAARATALYLDGPGNDRPEWRIRLAWLADEAYDLRDTAAPSQMAARCAEMCRALYELACTTTTD